MDKSSVILSVAGRSWELAPQRVIDAMFDTISVRLESSGRGTRFPMMMEDVYAGYLNHSRAAEALRELREIETALRSIPVSAVVWSMGGTQTDAGEPVNRFAANAHDYFVGADGQPLISSFRAGVEECLHTAKVLRLGVPGDRQGAFVAGLVIAAVGSAWMAVGWKYFPAWCLRSPYSRNALLPIWTFGMYLVMFGVAFLIAILFPGIESWFRHRPALLIAVVLSLPIAWLVICARAGFLPG